MQRRLVAPLAELRAQLGEAPAGHGHAVQQLRRASKAAVVADQAVPPDQAGLHLLLQHEAEESAKIEALRNATSHGIMQLESGLYDAVDSKSPEQYLGELGQQTGKKQSLHHCRKGAAQSSSIPHPPAR